MNSFPDLPVDVARHILEIAALHDREVAYHLVYVSKTVREWIDPILHHAVVLDRHGQEVFVKSCNSRRIAGDAQFFARNVKVLCIQGMLTHSLVQTIIAYCPGVEIFAAWFATEEEMPLPDRYITAICPRRVSALAINVSSPFKCISPRLTHLHVHDPHPRNIVDWKGIVEFCPDLTHILLDMVGERVDDCDEELLGEVTVNRFKEILNTVPPTFKALIFEVLESNDGSLMNDIQDPEFPGSLGTEGFDVAAANLVHVISDKRFVFIMPNSRFAYVSGLVCYEYTHNPLADWCYCLQVLEEESKPTIRVGTRTFHIGQLCPSW